jgi:methionine-gamma-lyase
VSNPLLEVADIAGLSRIAKNLTLMSLTTPSLHYLFLRKFGADIVIHSLTKYINGSSDTVGGVTCASQEFIGQLKDVNSGASMLLGPTMDSMRLPVMKKLRALHLRIKQHSHNALSCGTFRERRTENSLPRFTKSSKP